MNALPNQLSIFDTPATPDNIVPFPIQRHPHTQQRVSPIRDPQLIKQIYDALRTSGKHGLRNATIFILQIAIGRRTNDMLSMRLQDVYDFTTHTVKPVITVDEHKTGKTARDLRIPPKTINYLQEYIRTLKSKSPTSYLFPSQKRNPDKTQRPLNTSSLDNIYKEITSTIYSKINTPQTHISSYAARKTYGYNLYNKCMKEHNGVIPDTNINALDYIQSLFNHKDIITTTRYIGTYDAVSEQLAAEIENDYL